MLTLPYVLDKKSKTASRYPGLNCMEENTVVYVAKQQAKRFHHAIASVDCSVT
jgi:hypothetical protein